MLRTRILFAVCLVILIAASNARGQSVEAQREKVEPPPAKKVNQRPPAELSKSAASEPFDKTSIETMAKQCVRFDTEAGLIEIEMLPEVAPETVRNFLNLVALTAYDGTTFSRVVPGFVVQGGNLSTREKITPVLAKRAERTIADEPNIVRHVRGIVSMARASSVNSATTNFFILVGDAAHLDGTFAAFGRVTGGMTVVDQINKMSVEGDKPIKPVRLKRATVAQCPAQNNPTSE